jgi:uracil-DNA glycosylase family 4
MRLPLYTEAPQAAVADAPPRASAPTCTYCDLYKGVRSVCMSPELIPGEHDELMGGVLCVGEYPGRMEDAQGRPWTGPAGTALRHALAKVYRGPVVLTNAVACAPGARSESTPRMIERVAACRPHIVAAIRRFKPSRVLTFGTWGAQAVLGRRPPLMSVRRGYGWLIDEDRYPDPSSWLPVYMLVNPVITLRNRTLAEMFASDLAHAVTAQPRPKPLAHDGAYTVVVDGHNHAEAARDLRAAPWVVLDVESSGAQFNKDFRIETLTLWVGGTDHGWTWERDVAQDDFVGNAASTLVALLVDRDVPKVGSNVKYDALSVRCEFGFPLECMLADVRLLRKLREAGTDGHLEVMAELVGLGGHKEEAQRALAVAKRRLSAEARDADSALPTRTRSDMLAGCKPERYAYRYIPTQVRQRYNARDCYATEHLMRELEPERRSIAWREITYPAMLALEQIEAWGIDVDRAAVETFDSYLTARIAECEAKLRPYGEINFSSPKQLGDLLFGKLGLTPRKVTGSGAPSTDREVLDELADEPNPHPVVLAMVALRKYTKQRGTYARGMLRHVRDDGLIHASFLVDGTETGRISSSDPNLQNVPRPGDEESKMARDCFIAPPGYVLLEADYSQQEYRVAAALSGDPVMRNLFASDADFHLETAKLISRTAWGIGPEKVTSEHRQKAKAVGFACLYGKEAFGLSRQLGCSEDEAASMLDATLGRFTELRRYLRETVAQARRDGGVWVYWRGRPAQFRRIAGLGETGDDKDSRSKRGHGERQALNTPIQGGAAYYCNASLWPIVRRVLAERIPARVINTVHDSIYTCVRQDYVGRVARIVREAMLSHDSGKVPLAVEFKAGERWGSLEKYE